MIKTKYIVIDRFKLVVFKEYFQHREVAEGLTGNGGKVTGAGFIDQQGGVYGESFSLGIEPGEHDQRLVNDMFGINEHCNEICPFYGFKDSEVVEAPNCKV